MWTYSAFISRNKEIISLQYIYRTLAKIDKILQPWKGKYLYLWNSLVISQFTYLLMVLPTPSELLFKLY